MTENTEMDICEETEGLMKCFKCKERLYGSLNVTQKGSDGTFVFWNKYQIFLYEDFNYESAAKIFTPDFQIRQLILSDNYLVCVDVNGNIHTTSLKFKNAGQKRFKCSFQPREQGILHCLKYSSEFTLSLKRESDTYFLCVHKVNSEFQLEKQVLLEIDDKAWPLTSINQEKTILVSHSISKQDFRCLSKIFDESVWKNHSLVLISFDALTIYGCLFSQRSTEEVLCLKKLYTCPTEICDLKIIEKDELEILIGLNCGTLLQLTLNNKELAPKVIHLNTALSKFIINQEDSIIYTDGLTLWKAENIHSKENINFKQFLVKDVKDFIKYDDNLLCTTFTNLIYTFSTENEKTYLKCNKEAYCPVEKLTNSECLLQIKKEIDKNEEIITKIHQEGNYLTAVSLSRRPDIMDKVIQENVVIYENYEEAYKENQALTLTEELNEYFKQELILILVKITATTIQHSMSHILSDILTNIKIHITLSTDDKVLKTTTIKLSEPLKKMQILIPLQKKDITRLNTEIELISEIPGALDTNETIWTVLHRKMISLKAEHFIKIDSLKSKSINLKQPQHCIDDLICKTAENYHGELFKVTDISKSKKEENELPFYVKLPINYTEVVKERNTFKNRFNSEKEAFIQNCLSMEEFLKSKSNVFFEIANDKVILEILNDEFSNPVLKVCCGNTIISFDIRNFFANVFYGNIENYPNEEFISNALYTTTENIQKALKKCSSTDDSLVVLEDRLQKNVIASLPL